MSAEQLQVHQHNTPDHAAIAASLLVWYRAHRRDLPWRRTSDPYRIWVAEVMLQQTQVPTVIPYYERFLARFPTVKALAAADLDEVLALWQGLGYYARARNLHAAIQAVCARHGGIIPSSPREFRALPGVGQYTAGAVLSIAFGQDVAAVDANAARVLCRLFDYDGDPTTAEGKKVLHGHAEALLPHGQAGDFNQAMMELGATICLPRAPHCGKCPLGRFCRARSLGVQESRPVSKRRRETPHRELLAALVEREGKVLIARRLPQGLLGGLWELPCAECQPDEDQRQVLARAMRESLGLDLSIGAEAVSVQHAYTHFRVTVCVYRCAAQGTPTPSGPWDDCHWLAPHEKGDYGLTGVTAKALARLGWPATSGRDGDG